MADAIEAGRMDWGVLEPVPSMPQQSQLDKDPNVPSYATSEAGSFAAISHTLRAEMDVRDRMRDLVALRKDPTSASKSRQAAISALEAAQLRQRELRSEVQSIRRQSNVFANWHDHWAGEYVLKGSLSSLDEVVTGMSDVEIGTIYGDFSHTIALEFGE